ncbi:hypothetical protein GQR58_001673 [Nymphon striatum]|nr:hypothetical protein GQR58_001673 [Nymphon striatum]
MQVESVKFERGNVIKDWNVRKREADLAFQNKTGDSAKLREKRQVRRNRRVKYVCPFANGLFADPDNCRQFYVCDNNHPYTQRCPPSLFFDDRTKYCNFKTEGFTCGPVAYTTTPRPTKDPLAAKKCSKKFCTLPECYCSSDGTIIPGNLEPEETPQMILLGFDGALNEMNFKKYANVLNESRLNPNGCPITATFFVSHEYSSYFSIEQMFAKGHEIGLNSITYRGPEKWWATASLANLTEEFVGQREIIANFANIERENVLGIRAPYLEPGGENMFEMMAEFGFAYDSSVAVPRGRLPIWPYTLDYKLPHKCHSKKCPSRSYPGVWEIPLNSLYSADEVGGTCYLADQCVFFPISEDLVFDWLMENFHRHYDNNRAPLGLNFHINWFNERVKVNALNRFISTILEEYKDAYFVTAQQALSWVQTPEPIGKLQSFEPWKCPRRPAACSLPKSCALTFDEDIYGDVRYMPICNKCPAKYPWIGNYDGGYKKQYIYEEAFSPEELAEFAENDAVEESGDIEAFGNSVEEIVDNQ